MRLLPPLSTLILAGLVAAGGLALLDRWNRPVDISPQATATARSAGTLGQVRSLPAWKTSDAAELTAIVEAPLFIEGRTMPGAVSEPEPPAPAPEILEQEVAEEALPPPPPELHYGLSGVMIRNGERKALLTHDQTGAEVWVALDDRLAAWSVTAIATDRVTLANGGTIRTLSLYPR